MPESDVLLAEETATARLAQAVAALLRPGDLVALSGGLGAGKTSFARALLRALAQDPALEVPSPTFPLRIDHALPRLPVVHADLYRLSSDEEVEELGFDEALSGGALMVEWPERLPQGLTEERLDVALAIEGTGRRAKLSGTGTWPARLERIAAMRGFLDAAGWGDAARTPLVGDASSRAYERLSKHGATAILMNAPARSEGPPIHGGRSWEAATHRSLDVRPFVAIDLALRRAGFNAPELLSADLDAGLLLLEDFGGEGLVDAAGAPILERYEAAIDALASLHAAALPRDLPLPDGSAHRLPDYDRGALLTELSLFPDWFGRQADEPAFPAAAREPFLAAWSDLLERLAGRPEAWVLLDFHSPNILWRPDEAGIRRVGILDFQDALIGDPAYDVASLAQDARVELSEAQEEALKARYVAARRAQDAGFDAAAFAIAYRVLAAQRATKVLGAFTRFALVEGKPGYQRHRERLKRLLRRNLADPVLSGLRLWYEPYL
jgi:tRNA threonylcarbamoyl adenosine modification protein YjeE